MPVHQTIQPEETMSPEARVKALRAAPADGWAAFSEDEERLLAYGSTYEEAVSRAEEKGVTELVIVKIPKDWTELALAN